MNCAGHDITLYLQALLKSECSLSLNYDTVTKIKETIFCNKKYRLPDGKTISITENDFSSCVDVLFKPEDGISQMIKKAIEKIGDPHVSRNEMYKNIVFAGGTSMIANRFLSNRVSAELRRSINPHHKVKIVQPQERFESQWIGGSILASLSTFQEMWITSDEYEECGRSIVDRKCF